MIAIFQRARRALISAVVATGIACQSLAGAASPVLAQDTVPTLRAGDVIAIVLPGEDAFSQPFQVSGNGVVVLPEVGPVTVSGLDMAAARTTIQDALATAYRDLDRFDLVLKDRRLLVQVLGLVAQPGEVDIPGGANVQTALEAAGGLEQGAQLDRLQLRRGGETTVFNYKQYLDTGGLEILPPLLPGDVVFVPASPLLGNVQVEFDARTLTSSGDGGEDGQAVKVFGEVVKPGIFSFKDGQSVMDLIMRAGGVTRYAGVEKIRVMTGGEPRLFNLKEYLDTGNEGLIPALTAGATIFVPIGTDEVRAGVRTVYVMGEVAKPGAYEMTEGATFFDVLANAGGPTRYAETRQIRVIRSDGAIAPFDLAGYTEGMQTNAVPDILAGDAIFVPEKADQEESSWLRMAPDRAIHVMGAVYRPGRYDWSDEMSLLDLLSHAGGPTAQADIRRVNILASSEDGTARPKTFNLESFMTRGGRISDLPQLRAGFTIMVPELQEDPVDNKSRWLRQPSEQSIYVMGSVNAPGRYAFDNAMGFLDILTAADGPSHDADLRAIKVSRRGAPQGEIRTVDLNRYLQTGDPSLLPRVSTGDVIYVPSRTGDWTQRSSEQTVRVLGAVGSPGRYDFDNRMTLLDLLAEAGGPMNTAWQEKILVVRVSPNGQPQAEPFDLIDFARTGDFSKLPQVRAGDTVYVPTTEQSDWAIFMAAVKDVAQVLSVFALLAAL